MEYPHGQEKLKSRFTTTATVGIGKKCTKQTKHDPRQNQKPSIQQWHTHRRPNSNNGAKEDNDNGSAGDVGCGIISLAVWVSWMGSGATTTLATKMDDDACPPQVIVTV
jgi:hypothetical protein